MTHISLYRPTGFWRQMAAGLHTQSSVIAALITKDFKARSGKVRLGIFWLIVDPMVMLVMLSLLWYSIGRTSIEGVNVVLYLSSGLITFNIVKQGIASVPKAIKANSALMNFPQVRPISCLVARFIFEMTLLLVSASTLYFLMWWFWGLHPTFHNPLRLIQVLADALLLGFGIALILGVYTTLYDTVGKIAQLVARPLMFVSCVIHSLHDSPPYVQNILLMNPITHLVDTTRTSMFVIQPLPQVNLYYPAFCGVCLVGVGIVAYYVNRFRLIQE